MATSKRYHLLDSVRGFAVINMVLFHAMYDLVYIFGVDAPWFYHTPGDIWQRAILITFIVVSGICWQMGKHKLRRGLLVFGASWVITAVTYVFMPTETIWFGVLSFLGSAMLIMIPFEKTLRGKHLYLGLFVSFLLFAVFYGVPEGYIGFFDHKLLSLPSELYANYFTAYLGFAPRNFQSSDWVPIFPWIFLYASACFLHSILKKHNLMGIFTWLKIPPLEWVGRHALIIYMLHQPLVYAVLYLMFMIIK